MHCNSNLKSLDKVNRLVKDELLADDFDLKHLDNFSGEREARQIDSHHDSSFSIFSVEDGWIESPVSIPVPIEKHNNMPRLTEKTAPRIEAQGLFYRKITEVVTAPIFRLASNSSTWSRDCMTSATPLRWWNESTMRLFTIWRSRQLRVAQTERQGDLDIQHVLARFREQRATTIKALLGATSHNRDLAGQQHLEVLGTSLSNLRARHTEAMLRVCQYMDISAEQARQIVLSIDNLRADRQLILDRLTRTDRDCENRFSIVAERTLADEHQLKANWHEVRLVKYAELRCFGVTLLSNGLMVSIVGSIL
jgi:hypothetical protein